MKLNSTSMLDGITRCLFVLLAKKFFHVLGGSLLLTALVFSYYGLGLSGYKEKLWCLSWVGSRHHSDMDFGHCVLYTYCSFCFIYDLNDYTITIYRRSLSSNFNKRFKSDFPRTIHRAPYGTYSSSECHVP